MRLNATTLARLKPGIATPRYDRAAIRPGIVHLGTGAFHRAHQAVAIDDCLARGETDWAILGSSLRGTQTRDALAPQDGLYTLAIRDSGREELRVIGSVLGVTVAPENPALLLDQLADPAIRIVTLTITEKGYAVDLGSGGMRQDHPDIVHDLAFVARRRDVEEDEFVGPLGIVGLGAGNGVAGVAELLKFHALDHTPVIDVETGYDAAGEHKERGRGKYQESSGQGTSVRGTRNKCSSSQWPRNKDQWTRRQGEGAAAERGSRSLVT